MATQGTWMSGKSQDPFHLGAWLVDPNLDTISRGGETLKLEPRMMRLLLLLADSPGSVISVDRMLTDVWSGVRLPGHLTAAAPAGR